MRAACHPRARCRRPMPWPALAAFFVVGACLVAGMAIATLPDYRAGQPHINMHVGYGPLSLPAVLSLWLAMAWCALTAVVAWIARMGELHVGTKALHVAHFCTGLFFALIIVDAASSSRAFSDTAATIVIALHILTELGLAARVLLPKPEVGSANAVIVVVVMFATFVSFACRQRTLAFFAWYGSTVNIPADVIALVACVAMFQRSRNGWVRLLALDWGVHALLVYALVGVIAFRARETDNNSGIVVLLMMVQNLGHAALVSKVVMFSEHPDELLDRELTRIGYYPPSYPWEEVDADRGLLGDGAAAAGGTMKAAGPLEEKTMTKTMIAVWFHVILVAFVGFCLVLPWALGKFTLAMLVE
uniref:Uncharacterized protein n=1 Tax=Diacronema lutheri TaxID=2081491 RepID=A0A7R9UQ52_DIALT